VALLASALVASVTLVMAIVPALHIPGLPDSERPPLYPAAPGYLLPWAGGEIHSVSQGEETSFTHNGLAAYAFDFDLDYEPVVAARSGRVTMTKSDSNSGGCSAEYSSATNYVVIDHGDGTSGVYMHLAYRAVLVRPGDLVEQGQPIAVSGETGVTCSNDDKGPGPHLHFQVERTEQGHYYTQSLPIAFDDISTTNGVPQEGQSYQSGDYGRGKPQKVKLTPHHVPRVFNPVAKPADPALMEAPPPPLDTPTPPPDDTPTPLPLVTETNTAVPDDTPTEEPSSTNTPVPTDTPTPVASPTPAPEPTPTPPPVTPTAPAASPTVAAAAPSATAEAAAASPSPPTPEPSPVPP